MTPLDLKQESKETYDLWVLCGRPRNGSMYELMESAKYKYKLAIRDAVKSFENRFSDELFEHLLSKDLNGFWRMWSAKTSKKYCLLVMLTIKQVAVILLVLLKFELQ